MFAAGNTAQKPTITGGNSMTIKNLILGGGYVGCKLADSLGAPMTRRAEENNVLQRSIYFDLNNRASWDNIPQTQKLIWTFPAAPLEIVKAFYRVKLANVERLFVYASTSCYLTHKPDEWINETQPLDLSRERVAGEEWLREQGATILVLAGIYGPNRHPQDWLEKGLITTPDKRVNLIHVDDIVAITGRLLAMVSNPRGERFNLADGRALRWREIAAHYGVAIQPDSKRYDSKRIMNDKVRKWLGGYCFRSLY